MSRRLFLGRGRLWFFLLANLFVGSAHALGPVDDCIVLLEEWPQSQVDITAFNTDTDSDDSSGNSTEEQVAEPIPLEQRLINEPCPQQVDVLVQHPWSALLAREPQELMLLDLRGFYKFTDHYAEHTALEVLDETKLANILLGLDLPPPEPISLWRRVLDWLKQWWQPEEEQNFDWLERFIPSETTLKIIMFVSIGLVVILAIGIIAVEMRVGMAHRRRVHKTRWSEEAIQVASGLSLADVQAAPLAEQPGLLLRWLLEQLRASGLAGLRASLTHRDIAAVTANVDENKSVARVSYAAERATFGGWVPSEQEMSELVELGKSVPSRLSQQKLSEQKT